MNLETTHVHGVYQKIATHFDSTRFSLWPGVTSFLDTIPPGSSVLDVGCGNGKYLSYRKDCCMYACDPCVELVDIAQQKHPHATCVVANGLALPWKDATFDAVISIAVLHHVSTWERRVQFMKEIARVLRVGGRACLTVWGREDLDGRRAKWVWVGDHDVMVPWTDPTGRVFQRFYHLMDVDEVRDLCAAVSCFRVVNVEQEKGNILLRVERQM